MAARSVSVRILGRPYRVRGDDQSDAVERAAELVDETMGRIRDRTGAVDSLDVAVLAALNLANQLVALRDARGAGAHGGDGVDPARLRALAERLESALGVGTAGS